MSARDEAAVVVALCGRFIEPDLYVANYEGETFSSKCTADLAEQIADYIGENVKADIADSSE